ncbi:SMI1/KNR4 family protein [Erwiniaceae bacterium BAC15a-03b]|uniref:SMI1/KNR4 family protein n=1 Tax=Winslowiella arboricola TaxID=2978220 RepID=A0A9J6PU81_9GAMM|nr:SMI1/KNR4 family protein [Winslowiella arboricola]MCU5771738.1 SMI1/KNR4 family protein [Winslowiella arboricola]MCU5777591.1 SMI1/KNR4 family protein [Winslowiella arboricola]
MSKDEIVKELEGIEKSLGINLPGAYKKFLSEEVQDAESYEIENKNGDPVYIFNYKDIVERNKTYTIQEVEPDYFLIGQDGDLGYFICSKDNSDKIYSLDLGALGSLDMDEEAKDLYELRA